MPDLQMLHVPPSLCIHTHTYLSDDEGNANGCHNEELVAKERGECSDTAIWADIVVSGGVNVAGWFNGQTARGGEVTAIQKGNGRIQPIRYTIYTTAVRLMKGRGGGGEGLEVRGGVRNVF